jgi:mono/diheme cytochrome c family protein
VNVIFENSCMGCHATDGKQIAMAKLNFSKWDQYKSRKQIKKAEAICKIISKGGMPPKSFRELYPEAIPTPSQIDMICKWSETLTQNN